MFGLIIAYKLPNERWGCRWVGTPSLVVTKFSYSNCQQFGHYKVRCSNAPAMSSFICKVFVCYY